MLKGSRSGDEHLSEKSTRRAGAALRQATSDEEATARREENTTHDGASDYADDDDFSPLPQSDNPVNRKHKGKNLFSLFSIFLMMR